MERVMNARSAAPATLHPDQYAGQVLCPRCGDDGAGNRYGICVEGFSHSESCARYEYGGLCAACLADMDEIYPAETDTP